MFNCFLPCSWTTVMLALINFTLVLPPLYLLFWVTVSEGASSKLETVNRVWPHVATLPHHTTQTHMHKPPLFLSLVDAYSHVAWGVTWTIRRRRLSHQPQHFIILQLLHMHRICRYLCYAECMSSVWCSMHTLSIFMAMIICQSNLCICMQ